MLVKKGLIIISLLLGIAFSARAQPSSSISEEQVIAIATQEFNNKSDDLGKIEEVTAVFLEDLGVWRLCLQQNQRQVGDIVLEAMLSYRFLPMVRKSWFYLATNTSFKEIFN